MISGRPPVLPWAAEHAAAVLWAGVPGTQGPAALADVLTGAAEPGGRLPVTVVREVGQIPLTYRHKPSGGRSHWKGDYVDAAVAPLWPFGHGLGYGATEFSAPQATAATVATGDEVVLSVDVADAGGRATQEVVQLYARHDGDTVTRPVRELVAWARVDLGAAERVRVTFAVPAAFLCATGVTGGRRLAAGPVTFWAGRSSADLGSPVTVELTGPVLAVDDRPALTPRVTLSPL